MGPFRGDVPVTKPLETRAKARRRPLPAPGQPEPLAVDQRGPGGRWGRISVAFLSVEGGAFCGYPSKATNVAPGGYPEGFCLGGRVMDNFDREAQRPAEGGRGHPILAILAISYGGCEDHQPSPERSNYP